MKRIGSAGLMLVVLLFAAQVVSAQGGLQDCPWGYPVYDAATHTFVSQCSTPVKVDVAAKPAGLAQPAPAPDVDSEQSPRCASFAGPNYSICVVAASATTTAKPAGLAQPAPTVTEETFVPCGFGERLDPLALACQQPARAGNTAAKARRAGATRSGS